MPSSMCINSVESHSQWLHVYILCIHICIYISQRKRGRMRRCSKNYSLIIGGGGGDRTLMPMRHSFKTSFNWWGPCCSGLSTCLTATLFLSPPWLRVAWYNFPMAPVSSELFSSCVTCGQFRPFFSKPDVSFSCMVFHRVADPHTEFGTSSQLQHSQF